MLNKYLLANKISSLKGNQLVQNSAWIFLGQGISIACQAGYFIVLARLMGAYEYGVYAGALAFVMLLSQYSTLGSSRVFMRYVCPDHSKFACYCGYMIMTTIFIGSAIAILIIISGPQASHSYTRKLLIWMAISNCLCLRFTEMSAVVFQTFEKMRITAMLNLLTNMLRMVMAIAMFLTMHHATAEQYALAALFISAIGAVIAGIVTDKQYGHPKLAWKLPYMHAKEGIVFAFTFSTGGILNDVDKVMLGHYGMNAANGIYNAAYQIVNVCTMPLYAVQTAAFPRFFKKGDTAGIASTASYALRIIKHTAPIGIILAVVMFITAPILPYIVGTGFSESAVALRWLCLIPFFRSFHIAAGDALTGANLQSTRLLMQIVSACFNFGINLYLIPLYGWYGAAWASLATDGILACLNWSAMMFFLRRHVS